MPTLTSQYSTDPNGYRLETSTPGLSSATGPIGGSGSMGASPLDDFLREWQERNLLAYDQDRSEVLRQRRGARNREAFNPPGHYVAPPQGSNVRPASSGPSERERQDTQDARNQQREQVAYQRRLRETSLAPPRMLRENNWSAAGSNAFIPDTTALPLSMRPAGAGISAPQPGPETAPSNQGTAPGDNAWADPLQAFLAAQEAQRRARQQQQQGG